MIQQLRLLLFLLALTGLVLAQDTFQDFLNQNDPKRATQAYLEDFQNYSAAVTAQYDAWEQQQEEAFLAYKQQVEEQWGEFLGSTNSLWVEYSATLGARTAVDYERGEVMVETIVEGADAQSEQNAIERNQAALRKLIADETKARGALADQLSIPGSNAAVNSSQAGSYAKTTLTNGQKAARQNPSLIQSVKNYNAYLSATFDKDYADAKVRQTRLKRAEAAANPKAVAAPPPTTSQLERRVQVEQRARQHQKQASLKLTRAEPALKSNKQPVTYSETIKGRDGKIRTKVTTIIPLVPDHIRRRAKQFRSAVDKEARQFGIDPALAYAVIHTESYFNPKAKSHIPAYGLMQLVPRSGARDAYQYIYKKDKLVDADYLYRPENNVKLGCGYLKKIRSVYFRKVKNDETAVYLTIAAYNTGVGNVARALSGTTKLSAAADAANAASPGNVYNRLMQKLPYAETRQYLDKVSARRKLYVGWR